MTSGYLTPNEVADLLNVARSTVYRAIKSGELVAYKLGGYRCAPEDIDRWVKGRRVLPQYDSGLAGPRSCKPKTQTSGIDFEALVETAWGLNEQRGNQETHIRKPHFI